MAGEERLLLLAMGLTVAACDCGPVPDFETECHESNMTSHCGQPQLRCGGWDSPWAGDPDDYERYYIECDGWATLWVSGPFGQKACTESWWVGNENRPGGPYAEGE